MNKTNCALCANAATQIIAGQHICDDHVETARAGARLAHNLMMNRTPKIIIPRMGRYGAIR